MKVDPFLEMTVDLVKAHLATSSGESRDRPALVRSVYLTFQELSAGHGHGSAGDPKEPDQGASEDTGGGRTAEPAIINHDLNGSEFEGLDSWLAARLPRRILRRLNRESSAHPSIFPDHLICLEDGEKVKLLRAYLKKKFGMTMGDYLDRWNLPDDYPTAPHAYLEAKRAQARATGLGVTLRAPKGRRKSKTRSDAA